MSGLPAGWHAATLGELGSYHNGRGFKRSEWRSAGRPIIRIQNLTGSSDHFNYYDGSVDARLVVRPGDLLVSWAATLGAYIWSGPEGVVNQHIFRVESSIDTRFHKYLIDHVLTDLNRQAHGSGMVHITRKPFLDTVVPLPPRDEQERIVAAIEEEFSRIEAAQRLMRDSRRRLDLLRAAALAEVTPHGGDWTTLGDVAEIVGGVTKDSKRQGAPALVEVPYLRVANVQRGYLDLNEVTTIRVTRQKAEALRLVRGDVLFNEGGDRDKLGRGWVWDGQIDRCIHQNHVFRARLRDPGFEPKYVSMHGNTYGREWFEKMGKQTTNLASINLRTLKAFPIPLLPLDAQRRVVAETERLLTTADAIADAVAQSSLRARSLQSSILSSALAGNLVN